MNEYEPLEIIGKGSFGTVRKVRNKIDGTILVRKEIEYNSMNSHERNQLISELRILRELNHPNIVKYYKHDHLPELKSIHIYMEYCQGGDLSHIITNFKKNDEKVPEEFIWTVMIQVLLALYRCHYGNECKKVNLFKNEQNLNSPIINHDSVIIHRDIKPDNIFLSQTNTIKLGDFGLAKMLTSQNEFAKTYVGTPYYMSPEVLMDQPYDPVCDIWSLGCVLYELCNLQPPFQAKTHLQLQAKIKRGSIPDIDQEYSSQLRNLISDCITVKPQDRPTCFELINTLSIRFLRKEMELKDLNTNLSDFKIQLIKKNDELKIKENNITLQERKLKEMEMKMQEEFELRKRQLELEAKELRLNYQREFKLVVEQELERLKNNSNNNINYKLKGPKELDKFDGILKTRIENKITNVAPKFRVTDELERQRHTPEYTRKYR